MAESVSIIKNVHIVLAHLRGVLKVYSRHRSMLKDANPNASFELAVNVCKIIVILTYMYLYSAHDFSNY